MRIISPYIVDFVATEPLKTHPNIGLHVFNQMADMDLAIGIR